MLICGGRGQEMAKNFIEKALVFYSCYYWAKIFPMKIVMGDILLEKINR